MPDVFVSEDTTQQTQQIPVKTKPIAAVTTKALPYFSAFCKSPQGIFFENQGENEIIVLFLREHFIRNYKWISSGLILLILPISLVLFNSIFHIINLLLPIKFMLIIIGLYYLLVFSFIFNKFIFWFFNFGLVTNQQIIDMDFNNIMSRNVAKARIHDVIDVSYDQGGILDSFFDFGNILIQTEGIRPHFEFESVPFPDKATDIILDLKEKAQQHV